LPINPQQMTRQSVRQLRLEPGRLRRHHLAGIGDRHQILHPGRMEREGNGHLARVDPRRQSLQAADAADEIDPVVAPRILDAEDRADEIVLQQADVEPPDRVVVRDPPGSSAIRYQ
jgi:hypothetical protein